MDRRLVHIVDDEAAIRRSTGFMLKMAGFATETWETGVEFLKEVRHAPSGCILLDVRMPELNGLQVQQALLERGVPMPVIMMTGHGELDDAVQAMRAGAVDFIDKPFQKETLLSAIDNAFDWLMRKDARAVWAEQASQAVAGLTEQERDVLRCLAQAMPAKAAAAALDLSVRAIELHRANLLRKLDARGQSDLIRIAFAAGLGANVV